MDKKVLNMVYASADGKKTSLSVRDPKNGVTQGEVKAVMDALVLTNVFVNSTGELIKQAVSAEIVVTSTETLF